MVGDAALRRDDRRATHASRRRSTIRGSTANDKESLLLSICGDRLDAHGRNFVRVLVEADRVALLPQISALFETLKDEADGVANATIETAFPLTDAQLGECAAALEKRFGKKIEADGGRRIPT